MSSLQLIVPLALASAMAAAVAVTHRRIPPRYAAALLTATIVAVSLAVLPAVGILAVGYVAHLSMLGGVVEWCQDALGVHAPVPPWLGLPSVAIVLLATVRARSVLRSWRSIRRTDAGAPEIVRSDSWFAFTLPGPAGRIVLSSALVDSLTPAELAVVVAHERTHACNRHDRYVLVADVANALLPVMRPLQHRLLFALERWADEASVSAASGDRDTVARTIARVALAHAPHPAAATGLAGLGVAARVDALTNPRTLPCPNVWTSAVAIGPLAVMAAAAVQVHHLFPLIVALCVN
ncbi:MAG: M56 family metallopeptidase [Ilumatobacteraceae bacterium]